MGRKRNPCKRSEITGKGIVEFLDFAKDTFDPQTLAGLEKMVHI